MSSSYDCGAPKKLTNPILNIELLRPAKDFDLTISAILETALAEVVKQKRRKEWLEESNEGIEIYNKKVHEFGLFSDELRTF
jgi:antitoxin CcdA